MSEALFVVDSQYEFLILRRMRSISLSVRKYFFLKKKILSLILYFGNPAATSRYCEDCSILSRSKSTHWLYIFTFQIENFQVDE